MNKKSEDPVELHSFYLLLHQTLQTLINNVRIYICYILVMLNGLFYSQPVHATSRDTKHLSKLIELIENNLPYDNDISTDSIIAWEKELESHLEKEKRHELLFQLKRLVSSAYSIKGDITIAVDKAHTMYQKAKDMGYDRGMVYALHAIGDAYLNANKQEEAIHFYQDALNSLDQLKESSSKQKMQIYPNLILTLLDTGKTSKALVYLKEYETRFDQNPTRINRFFISACYSSYYTTIGEMEKARTYLLEMEKANTPTQHCYLNYIQHFLRASYHNHNQQHKLALAQYEKLNQSIHPAFTPNQSITLNMRRGQSLVNLGKIDEACHLYQNTIALQDSLDNLSYTRQINELRAIYQIDQMEIENQSIRNKIIIGGIITLLSILVVIIILAILIRKENRRLLQSKTELEKAQKYAEKSILTKSVLLSNMSHEIRTPLNALSGFSAILTEDAVDKETRRQCNEIIQQNSELLLKLINDVIDLSNFEIGKLAFNFKTTDVVTICQNVIDTVEKVKQTQARLHFVTRLESLELHTDEARLQQVLINLLINATKFTFEGTITLELEKQSETIALFSVTDTGCGIPKEKQGQIFNRFEKLNENAQGTGLGLSICQLIIEQFGGKIWIDPDYTEGSRFRFTHPISSVRSKEKAE